MEKSASDAQEKQMDQKLREMKRNQRTCVRIQMSRRARKDMSTGRIQDLWADP